MNEDNFGDSPQDTKIVQCFDWPSFSSRFGLADRGRGGIRFGPRVRNGAEMPTQPSCKEAKIISCWRPGGMRRSGNARTSGPGGEGVLFSQSSSINHTFSRREHCLNYQLCGLLFQKLRHLSLDCSFTTTVFVSPLLSSQLGSPLSLQVQLV
jgi:hypothetical protein